MAIYFIESEILEPKKNARDENFGDLKSFKNLNWRNYLQNGTQEDYF